MNFLQILYIDPGTGSLIISLITGAVMTLAYSFRGWGETFLNLITQRKYKSRNDFSGALVFFSEGSNYWATFKPVLDALNDKLSGGAKVLNSSPKSIKVDVSTISSKNIKIKSNIDFELEKQFYLTQDVRIEPSEILVNGPKSILDTSPTKDWVTLFGARRLQTQVSA